MSTPLSLALQKSLADTFVLYSKVHSFHWNVTGPRFLELHAFFEEIYTYLWKTMDTLAEEIRIMGDFAPVNIAELTANASIVSVETVPNASEMIDSIIADFDILMNSYKKAAEQADDADEEGIEGILLGLVAEVKKTQWKLQSLR